MDRLREMEVFLAVTRSGGFTHAARQLNTSRSSVTKIIAGLEARLGVRLINRSTHNISLTTAGQVFAQEAGAILAHVEQLRQQIKGEHVEMAGDIRIGSPPSFASHHLLLAMQQFRLGAPGITFNLVLDDGSVDIVRESLDVSIRIAPILPDTALIARLLVKVPQVLVAAPDYLLKFGNPTSIDDLTACNCLVHSIKSPSRDWVFADGRVVRVHGTIMSNSGEVLHNAALSGEGISVHPTYMVSKDLKSGRLVRVLSDFSMEGVSIYAVYAERLFRPKRVLVFLEFLRDWLQKQADWFETHGACPPVRHPK